MAVFGTTDLQRLDTDLKGTPAAELERLARLALNSLRQQTGEMTVARATGLQKALIAGRRFGTARDLGESLRTDGISSNLLGKFLVQALIDSDRLAQAEQVIAPLLQEVPPEDPEHLELEGLRGRIAKQRYINDSQNDRAQPNDLLEAIDRYLTAYETNPARPTWHGINAVALLARAERDGMGHPEVARLSEIAGTILKRIQRSWDSGDTDFWNCATASEAALALGQQDKAELWLYRYLADQDLPFFAIASTLRQYREVWNLSPRTLPGSVLLPLLERKLAEAGQMLVPLENARTGTDGADFEKVFGKASFLSFGKYSLGIERAKAVARVEDQQGDPQGTGFLVRGADLGPKFALYDQVLLTNAHVISDSDPKAALSPDKARCTFYGLTSGQGGTPATATVKELLCSSPPSELDTSIVSLEGIAGGVEPCPLARALPKPGPDSKIFIIGYPQGGGLSFSLFDSELLAYEETGPKMHYRTPTEPGSSGSPVFNSNWELVAIHHSGASDMKRLDGPGTYEANEGIKILSLKEALGL